MASSIIPETSNAGTVTYYDTLTNSTVYYLLTFISFLL